MRYKSVDLTPEQEKAWDNCRAALVHIAPAFSHVFFSMMQYEPKYGGGKHIAFFTRDIPVAATDGKYMMINPDTFFQNYHLYEQVFICCHEIMHCSLKHCYTKAHWAKRGTVPTNSGAFIPFVDDIAQRAADYVVNDMLHNGKMGKLPTDGLHDPKIGAEYDAIITVYERLYKDHKGGKVGSSQSGAGKAGKDVGNGPGRFDDHLDPGQLDGQDPTTAEQQRSDPAWDQALAQGIAVAKAMGRLPANLERIFGEQLDPVIPWAEHIQGFFSRHTGYGRANWKKPDRRFIVRDIWIPSTSDFRSDLVVAGVDTSGSITDPELNIFFSEMHGILEMAKPSRLMVIWCDAKVHRVDEITDMDDLLDLRNKKAPGGGGTAFEPVFEHIKKLGDTPDALVYFTDGMGSFPKRSPPYPTIWASILAKKEGYPWGDYVEVPLRMK